MTNLKNIFSEIPDEIKDEIFHVIYETKDFKLERIISNGQSTPQGQWYDQRENEWVILLKGSTTLLFEDNMEIVNLKPGDYILIPSRKRHRVEKTSENEITIWLALHY